MAGPACGTSSRRPWAWKDSAGARGPGPHPGACPLPASVGPGPPARSGPRFVSVRLSFGLLGGWQGRGSRSLVEFGAFSSVDRPVLSLALASPTALASWIAGLISGQPARPKGAWVRGPGPKGPICWGPPVRGHPGLTPPVRSGGGPSPCCPALPAPRPQLLTHLHIQNPPSCGREKGATP